MLAGSAAAFGGEGVVAWVLVQMQGLQPALLADAASTGDPRSDHNPDLEAAVATKIVLHPITGTYADKSHQSEFAALLFRKSFPVHVSLLSLLIAGSILYITVNSPPEMRASCAIISLCMTLGLIGRVFIHLKQGSETRGQRMGALAWMALLGIVGASHVIGVAASACAPTRNKAPTFLFALADLAGVVLNGSHGMGFVCKGALIGLILTVRFCTFAICHHRSVGPMVSVMLVLAAGFLVTHIAELRLRYSYAEKVRETQAAASEMRRLEEEKRQMQEKEQFDEEDKRRLELRNEQLKAEKERLLYDLHRRGQPLDDDNRSAIRHGLQARPAGSPPASLPPGPPHSTTDSNSTEAPFVCEEAVRRWHAENASRSASVQSAVGRTERESRTEGAAAASNAVALPAHSTLPAAEASSICRDVLELAAELVAADVRKEAADAAEAAESAQAAVSRMQLAELAPLSELGTAHLTWDETKCRWITRRPEDEAKCSWRSETSDATPGVASSEPFELKPELEFAEMAETAEIAEFANTAADEKAVAAQLQSILGPAHGMPVGSPAQDVQRAAPYCEVPPPPQVNGTTKLTPKQALHLARHRIQYADTDAKVYEVVRALAIALGASRPEAGTIRALHAVLIQLAWPGTSNVEACTFTNASMSNFARWRRRVAKAETAPVDEKAAEMVQVAQ